MKLHAFLLSSLLAIAGCEKTSNVTAMQDEATGLANHYKARLEEMSKRITMLEQRGRSMVSIGTPQGLNDVRALFTSTNKRLFELKQAVAEAPKKIKAAAASENPRVELIKEMGELHERLDKGELELNANIDQVEQWLAYVEYRPKVAAAEPKTEPAPMPEPKKEELPENPDGKDVKKDPGAPADAPKGDAPKADGPKGVAPPKADAPKAEPKKDAAKADAPKAEPKKDAAKAEPKKAEPKKDAPKAGAGSAR